MIYMDIITTKILPFFKLGTMAFVVILGGCAIAWVFDLMTEETLIEIISKGGILAAIFIIVAIGLSLLSSNKNNQSSD